MMKRMCKCGKLIEYKDKYCDSCEEELKEYKSNMNAQYDRYRRNKKSTSFYNSKEWLVIREYILGKYKGLDLYAFFIDKKIVLADTVHHIEELKENWDRRLDITNLFPLTDSNHNKIHSMYKNNKEQTQQLLIKLLKNWNEFSK